MAGNKSKMIAALLALFLGYFGIHNFYLGNSKKAVMQIVVTIVTCGIGSVWGFVDAIFLFTGKIDTDAAGNKLV